MDPMVQSIRARAAASIRPFALSASRAAMVMPSASISRKHWREPAPSTTLTAARDAVSRLVMSWNDSLADSIAAMNLYLDEAKDRRQRAIAALVSEVGQCRSDGPFAVENALRGQWIMPCERGRLRVAITLAPTMPPKVQYLSVRRAEGDESLRAAPTCPVN